MDFRMSRILILGKVIHWPQYIPIDKGRAFANLALSETTAAEENNC